MQAAALYTVIPDSALSVGKAHRPGAGIALKAPGRIRGVPNAAHPGRSTTGRPEVLVVTWRETRTLARASVRAGSAHGVGAVVCDVDGSYGAPVGAELVLSPQAVGIERRELHKLVITLDHDELSKEIASRFSRMQRDRGGRLVDHIPAGLVILTSAHFRSPLILDSAALASALSIERDSSGQLILDGAHVTALDLSRFDPEKPWVLDARGVDPGALLSRHPRLVSFLSEIVDSMRNDVRDAAGHRGSWDPQVSSLGTAVDAPLRHLYRASTAVADEALPDAFEDRDADALLRWLAQPAEPTRPARYLEAILATRPDLQAVFPGVPGGDTGAFLAWAATHAVAEGYPAEIVDEALRRTPQPRQVAPVRRHAPGVTVVGYLTAELGIGESARRMVDALAAAGVPHAERPIDLHLASRHAAAPAVPDGPVYDTTLICVNADLTPAVAAAVPELVRRSYRIGMWYWEVEEFPASQHGGFAAVDEVWVATEFVHRAIAPHSPVPVRTLTPPLPQRGPEPQLTKADLGLPDRPVFLFSFDYLSTAERKNPVGLVDAFERAFEPDEGPVLVIKSINADKRVADAERLRLRAASRPDVLLLEDYLDASARDALVARCDCYVSLHRSEGLGLTMAEAMAWGKPVIATAYSGNLQFMTEENSFLVPWSPVAIPSDAPPYPQGAVWAEPDLDAAAAFMRLVVDSPDVAAARGARAAQDIATLHNAEVAGRRIAARLEELRAARRARSRRSLVRAARRSARAAIDAFRDELR